MSQTQQVLKASLLIFALGFGAACLADGKWQEAQLLGFRQDSSGQFFYNIALYECRFAATEQPSAKPPHLTPGDKLRIAEGLQVGVDRTTSILDDDNQEHSITIDSFMCR